MGVAVTTKESSSDSGAVSTLRSGWNLLALVALVGFLAVALAYATDPGALSQVLGWAASGFFAVCTVRLLFVRAQLRGNVVREVGLFRRRDWHPVSARTLEGAGFPIGTTWTVGLLLETGQVRELPWQMVYGKADVPARKLKRFCDQVNTATGAGPNIHWPGSGSEG